jgi:hypothetical protein
VSCGDVEQHDLVCTRFRVTMRKFGGIACVFQVDKINALYNAAV